MAPEPGFIRRGNERCETPRPSRMGSLAACGVLSSVPFALVARWFCSQDQTTRFYGSRLQPDTARRLQSQTVIDEWESADFDFASCL